ncbi:TlpA family protein disulfide reductase [Flavisolibacter nicotianae]|uniref:TlpA family protein disulfide reductase n=1 Tax=Flavisolibacter nicotianae TaxID=2364882 RepID=UPI000EB00DE0|nr:TlpA family protein disulfide reductase [Flavisolibacter nicotianae]
MKKKRLSSMLLAALAMGLWTEAQTVPRWSTADLQHAINTTRGPVILNFWATFCKPCIAEMPRFQAMARRYRSKGVKLILVSLDMKESYPREIAAFVKKREIRSAVVFLDEQNADRFVPLVDTSWSGAIPATLFLYPAKNYRAFFEEELSGEKLDAEVRRMLGKNQ